MPKQNKHNNKLSRREFIRFTGGCVGAGTLYLLLKPSTAKAAVRPPGAAPIGDFESLCSRCGRCVSACEQCGMTAIHLDEKGLPQIEGIKGWCDFCLWCADVCPTGAIQPVDPDTAVIGLAVIDRDRCIPWVSSGCRLCYEKCIDIENAIWIDENNRPHIDETLCTGCSACVMACPVSAVPGQHKRHGKVMKILPLSKIQTGEA